MEKIKNFFKKIWSFKIVKLILLAFCVNLVCDILNQRSILDALVRLFAKPLNFIYNMLLIMSTIALCTLFKKRKFAILICLTLWLVIAIVNFIVQCFRNTPFSFMDLKLIPSVFSAFNSYLNLFEVILIIVLVCGVIVGFVFLFKKEGNKERLIKYSLITCAVIVCMLFITHVPLTKVGAISDDYSNLTAAYEEYGLPYCFVKSVISTGVDKVDDYNKEILDEVVDNIKIYEQQIEKNSNSEYTVDTEIKPNIIFLQLESFMDPNNIIDLNYSINPTPTFQYLKENYPSGTLKVPSVGAGTANVEFEIMTGFNLDHFAAGEYPYTSVVNKKTVESIGYLLKQEGYYNSIIHNNRATFYNRDKVFPNLGYDKFVSAEVMVDLKFTDVGWYKDDVLQYEIMKALNSTEQSDFIYTISVQPHGKYLEDLTGINNMVVDVTSTSGLSQERVNQFKYYVNQLYEVDQLLANLMEEFEKYSEPTMLVIYGDHLPTLDLEDEDVIHKDLYKSEYVIYTNYELELEDKDLYSYQLSSHVLQTINCNKGMINKIHSTRDVNSNYQEDLKKVIYDIVEGEMYIYNGVNPYMKTNMEFGYDDTRISNVILNYKTITIKGENFNLSSVVYINNKKHETTYIDKNTLQVQLVNEIKEMEICVKQAYNSIVYQQSNIYSVNTSK